MRLIFRKPVTMAANWSPHELSCTRVKGSIAYVVAFVFSVFQSLVAVAQVEPFELSLIENQKMIKSFDVLFREQTVDGNGIKYECYTRLAVSFEEGHFCCVRTGEMQAEQSGKMALVPFTDLGIANGKVCRRKLIPNRVDNNLELNWMKIAELTEAPEIRMVGLARFPVTMASNGKLNFAELVRKGNAAYMEMETTHSVRPKGGAIEQTRVRKRELIPEGHGSGRFLTIWDPASMVPLQRFTFVERKKRVEAFGRRIHRMAESGKLYRAFQAFQ